MAGRTRKLVPQDDLQWGKYCGIEGLEIMETTAYRMLYDSIHEFKATAVLVESNIIQYGICNDSEERVSGMNGRTHHDMWVSMKTVSHFNLGIALELMLKLLLTLNNIPLPHHHKLAELYDVIPAKFQRQLEKVYQDSRALFPKGYKLVAFINSNSSTPMPPSQPSSRDIPNLVGFFRYLDEDVRLWQKRYSWELVGDGRWRHYLSDISVFVALIDHVMRGIPRH